jgi:hypothetical protein
VKCLPLLVPSSTDSFIAMDFVSVGKCLKVRFKLSLGLNNHLFYLSIGHNEPVTISAP